MKHAQEIGIVRMTSTILLKFDNLWMSPYSDLSRGIALLRRIQEVIQKKQLNPSQAFFPQIVHPFPKAGPKSMSKAQRRKMNATVLTKRI